jgi:hypothetical protein
MLDRDRTSYSFNAAFSVHAQAHSILKSNPRISFSSRFDFLSFRTAWASSRLVHCGKKEVLFARFVDASDYGSFRQFCLSKALDLQPRV